MNPILSLKLGKKPHRHDPRRLMLAKYMASDLPSAPGAYTDLLVNLGPLGMMENDRLGDCTCAAVGHMIQAWTADVTKTPCVISDADVLALYEGACGYNPANPATDQGGFEPDVLNYWRANGVAGHKILAYADADPQNLTEVQQAAWLFGGLYLGIALPISAQSQVGGIWDVVAGPNAAPGSWGGHAVPVVAYDQDGPTIVTWGALQKMTWAFFKAYCDEAHAVLSPDWIEASGSDPTGFDLATLQKDLAEVTA